MPRNRTVLRQHTDDIRDKRLSCYRSPSVRIWPGEGATQLCDRSASLLLGIMLPHWHLAPAPSDEESLEDYAARLNDYLVRTNGMFFKDVSRRRDRHIFRTFKLVHTGFNDARPPFAPNRPTVA